MEFWSDLKAMGDVLVPWVILPILWYAWRIADEMRRMREEHQKDHKATTERMHGLELRQAKTEAEVTAGTVQRDSNHAEIMRRLDDLADALKGKADKA